MGVDEVDSLLERYLGLLHEYTTLRTDLTSLQTGMYQNIARANFSAERGIRYGQDFYDDRMQASRRLETATDRNGVRTFEVVERDRVIDPCQAESDVAKARQDGLGMPGNEGEPAERAMERVKKPSKKNPAQWFGLLTPVPLRQAQAQSIKAVEEVIPRLVAVDAEMHQVEIEVRRARKKRAKAEAATAKQHQEGVTSQELIS